DPDAQHHWRCTGRPGCYGLIHFQPELDTVGVALPASSLWCGRQWFTYRRAVGGAAGCRYADAGLGRGVACWPEGIAASSPYPDGEGGFIRGRPNPPRPAWHPVTAPVPTTVHQSNSLAVHHSDKWWGDPAVPFLPIQAFSCVWQRATFR